MKNETLKKVNEYAKAHQQRKKWKMIMMCLAAIVVCCTAYVLILPAVTLEKQSCKIPEHTHSGKCYAQGDDNAKKTMICSAESLNLHKHTNGCYDSEGKLICGYSDFVVHTHDSSCYDEEGNLLCPLPEIKVHAHTDSCYAVTENVSESQAHVHTDECYTAQRGELVCPIQEGDGHTHSEEAGCYDENGELVCPMEESDGHWHTDDCYNWEKVLICGLSDEPTVVEPAEPQLICGKDEIILHEHTPECFDGNGQPICGKTEVLEHVHGESCFQKIEMPADKGTLICTQEEHTHSEECKVSVSLNEKEQAQVDEVIALIDALPNQKEIENTLTAFEDADDTEGYDGYLSELRIRAMAAHNAYEALTDDQKLYVTNADRLKALEWLWSMQTVETDATVLNGDYAYVARIAVSSIADGVTPWDANDEPGNDSGVGNKIVRTFDTLTYNFNVAIDTYGTDKTYTEARVRLEFVLPLTEDQACFDQAAMAWMDMTSGYEPKLTTETREIGGEQIQCQVLTCYKHLLPSGTHSTAAPGEFGENVTVNVKSMKNGDTFAPIFSAAMEYNTWDGECTEHAQVEKKTIVADEIKVSATPKYNIKIDGQSSYKSTFDFNTGNEKAPNQEIGQVSGRVMKMGVILQLYNDNASKGIKGIELPDGSPITFDIEVGSQYTINTDNSPSGKPQGTKVDTSDVYTPLLWSCDGNLWTTSGEKNSDDRVLYEPYGCAQNMAPYNRGGGENACNDGGEWKATQEGTTIHVTVSGYQIDVDKMPIKNADEGDIYYGTNLGIGCFSAGEFWIVQPFNELNSNSQEPNYDIVNTYGPGAFTTFVNAMNMKATTVSGKIFQDTEGTNDAQTKTDDDSISRTLELVLPGNLQNRVRYASFTDMQKQGVGVTSNRDGRDFATPGTELYLMGGFSYTPQNEEENILYWGTNLTKFYGSAFELGEGAVNGSTGGASAKMTVLYATKPDGKDWKDDNELLNTYEDDLVFYKSLSAIPEGHLCVGLLYCFQGPGPLNARDPYYMGYVPAKVRSDMSLAGNTYMLASTSRMWTKSMFENAGKTVADVPDWTATSTKLNSFPSGFYKSGNITDSTWYTKETYAADGSGALGTHNSDWSHWGDTLLVIGYKTGITKNLAQYSGDVEKNTYNLDAHQRVADFVLQPRTYFDQGENNESIKTTVTIVDTLPKHLTYIGGSAYYGGTYYQDSVDGGTQGRVENGKLLEPEVKKNSDGTTTLTWRIENVSVGEELPPIYYSTYIGNRSVGMDVPTGTTNLLTKVHISATHDLREPSKDNGNYAESGIAVTRGSASAYGKYVKQTIVEPDGQIDYVVYYDNNSATTVEPVLMDTMPYNGSLGSTFTGEYTISSFQIEKDLCKLDNLQLYYTMDEKYKDKTLKNLQENQENPIGEWAQATIEADGTVPALINQKPVAWVVYGRLENGESIAVDYSIKLAPETEVTSKNKYINTFSSGGSTITTTTITVDRSLEGLTWMDDSKDGIQNEETGRRISGVKVTLLKLKTGGDPYNESHYVPYHYQGDSSKPEVTIETGQQISVRASDGKEAVGYEQGRYKFNGLPAGTFAVRFEDGSHKISPLIASPDNQGSDDTLDSDGKAVYSADKTCLEKTVILKLELPTAEEMQMKNITEYNSDCNDSGFYERGHELPETGGIGNGLYTFIGMVLIAASMGCYICQRRKRNI
ncbi:LPXTG cell wall anchor domain-containing protein [Frisingicoccus sp.]|uniref:LPXTG cell wall anchor domain-containing protein n=1 Tax=Frisingicoccus sp. TaxID=1918627 RepID=UPI00399C0B8C